MEQMVENIFQELSAVLSGDVNYSDEFLIQKIRSAYREVVRARKYPKHYTAEYIENDMLDYEAVVVAVALYDYNQIGAEGETTHAENGISRQYVNRNRLFDGVLPIARM